MGANGDNGHYLRPLNRVRADLRALCAVHDVDPQGCPTVGSVATKLISAGVNLNRLWYRLLEEAAHYSGDPA